MRRISIPVVASLAMLLALSFSTGYLFRELDQANAHLQATRETLLQSNADLVAVIEAHNTLVAERDALTTTLADVKSDRDRLRDEAHELSEENRTLAYEKSVLTQEYDHLKGAHDQLTDTNQQLGVQHEALQVVHQDLQASFETTQERNEALATELGDANTQVVRLSSEKLNLETLFGDLRQEYVDLQFSYQDLDAEHTALTQAAGTVETLEVQAGALSAEIARLEERRRPLILADESVGWFKCTGSMEPKLTCLDTATWLYDFEPEDIVVGATLSVHHPDCGGNWPDGVLRAAHRVIDIKVEDGDHLYWLKGDNNESPDGCWVPHTAVRGYIIEIHKNTRPANAALRNSVNAAKVAYNAARDNYYDLRESQGCRRDQGTCVVYTNSAYNALTQAYRSTVQALDHYNCWYRNARDSEYPGHIPYRC